MHVEWGPHGAARATAGGLLVVVDVLSFTTSVSVCADRGTAVYPAAFDEHDERAVELAEREGAVLAAGRRAATPEHPWSLSPAALRAAPAPARLVLPSPNGSAIAAASPRGVTVVAACLRNATAVGRWVARRGARSPSSPRASAGPTARCGPRSRTCSARARSSPRSRTPRPARALSPEADAARTTWLATHHPADAVRACASGRELVLGGFAADVEIAVEIDASDVVPVLTAGAFGPLADTARRHRGSWPSRPARRVWPVEG